MEKQQSIMQHEVLLAEPLEEGLIHIRTELNKGKLMETVYLFEDIVQGFTSLSQG